MNPRLSVECSNFKSNVTRTLIIMWSKISFCLFILIFSLKYWRILKKPAYCTDISQGGPFFSIHFLQCQKTIFTKKISTMSFFEKSDQVKLRPLKNTNIWKTTMCIFQLFEFYKFSFGWEITLKAFEIHLVSGWDMKRNSALEIEYSHSIPSYKKRWEILTSCVSYFTAVFLWTLFLNFSPILNSRFLIFP